MWNLIPKQVVINSIHLWRKAFISSWCVIGIIMILIFAVCWYYSVTKMHRTVLSRIAYVLLALFVISGFGIINDESTSVNSAANNSIHYCGGRNIRLSASKKTSRLTYPHVYLLLNKYHHELPHEWKQYQLAKSKAKYLKNGNQEDKAKFDTDVKPMINYYQRSIKKQSNFIKLNGKYIHRNEFSKPSWLNFL